MTRRHLVTRRKALALGAGSVFAPYIWPAGAQTRTVYVNSLRRRVGNLLEEGVLRSVHRPDRNPDQDRARRFVCQAQGAGADPELRMGRHQPRRRGVRPGGARRPAGESRRGGGENQRAAAEHGPRVRHHQLFARHQYRLSQGQVSERRPAELGGFLGREEVSRATLPVRPLVQLPGLCDAGRWRAGRQALSRWISTAHFAR